MKRIISVILCFAMLFGLFSGLNSTAAEDVLVLTTGNAPVFGESVTATKSPYYDDIACGIDKIQTDDYMCLGYSTGVILDCEEYAGSTVKAGCMDIRVYPNVTVNAENDLYLTYLAFPLMNPVDVTKEWWDTYSIRWPKIVLTQNGVDYSADLKNTSVKYLSKSGSTWQSAAFNNSSNAGFPSLNGFEGYIMIDLSTMTVDAAAWADFNWDSDYVVKSITYENRILGAELGAFKIGGWYGVENYSDTINARISGTNLVRPLNSSGGEVIAAVTAERTNFGTSIGSAAWSIWSGYGDNKKLPDYGTTYTTAKPLENCAGGWNSVKISSPQICGYLTENIVYHTAYFKAYPNDGSNQIMMYFELPETGLGFNSIAIKDVVASGYLSNQDSYGLKYKYLSIDSNEWIEGIFDDKREIILPDGFKGYIKMPIVFMGGRNSMICFNIGLFGGEYGDAYIGAFYDLVSDADVLKLQIDTKPEVVLNTLFSDNSTINIINENIASVGDVTLEDALLIQKTERLYSSLSAEEREEFTEQQQDLYDNVMAEFKKFRPFFTTTSLDVEKNTAKLSINANINADKAVLNGYSVVEYGIVEGDKDDDLGMFTSYSLNSRTDKFTNNDPLKSRFEFNTVITSSRPESFEKSICYRAYVVFSNGTNRFVVWNENIKDANGKINGYLQTSFKETAESCSVNLPLYSYGNVNGDFDATQKDIIDSKDLISMRKHILEIESAEFSYTADVNADGMVNVRDIVRLKKYMAGAKVRLGKTIDLLECDNLDAYGDKSINIIGDSISYGVGVDRIYDESWGSLFKKVVNDYWGSNNIGYASLFDGYADDAGGLERFPKEIHRLEVNSSQWKLEFQNGLQPGGIAYSSVNTNTDSVITINVNRRQDDTNRHINGFYIQHSVGTSYGLYNVFVNDTAVASIDCYSSVNNRVARSQYIEIPESCGDEIVIKIVKPALETGMVRISGICYIDDPNAPSVNNFSLGGFALSYMSESLIKEVCKAETVVLTLGTNDALNDSGGTGVTAFKQKLQMFVNECRENGSNLIIGDVMWNTDNSEIIAQYKQALREAAENENVSFVDLTVLPANEILNLHIDILHPNKKGCEMIAQKMCEFVGVEFFK